MAKSLVPALAALAFGCGAPPSREEGTAGSAALGSSARAVDSAPASAPSSRCVPGPRVEASAEMRAFVSKLGTPSETLKALREVAAPGADIRPMRWNHYEEVQIECRWTDETGADCYETFSRHQTTESGYFGWSRHSICWHDGRMIRVARLASGGDGGP